MYTVVFGPGEAEKAITFTIVDDSTPELDELFVITISRANGAVIGRYNSWMTVTILQNDDANGVFSLHEANKLRDVDEADLTDEVITFIIQRARGTFGAAVVTWAVTGDVDSEDVDNLGGTVSFQQGEMTESFTVSVKGERIPELAEVFQVALVSVDGGARLSDANLSAIVTIHANDDPHGIVLIPTDSQKVLALGDSRELRLTFNRVSGAIDSVVVPFALSHSSDTTQPCLPHGISGFPTEGNATFVDGADSVVVVIPIAAEVLLEEGSAFCVQLSEPSLTGGRPKLATSTFLSPRLGSPTQARASVPRAAGTGYVVFASAEALVNEGGSTVQTTVTVIRSRGTFGDIDIAWSLAAISPITASVPEDLSPAGGIVHLNDGDTFKTITIESHPDDLPELDEKFQLRMNSVSAGYTEIHPDFDVMTITIPLNDDPYGVFKFRQPVYEVQETDSAGQVTMTVDRLAGDNGLVIVSWRTEDGSALADTDYTGATNQLIFKEGERSQTITVAIFDNGPLYVPEKLFDVVLFSPVGGARLHQTDCFPRCGKSAVKIQSCHHCRVEFMPETLAFDADEPVGQETPFTFALQRGPDAFGQATVQWELKLADGADASADMAPVTGEVRH